MTTHEIEEHKQYTFEAFCKTVLRNKARNIHKKLNRIEQREVLFADIPAELEAMLYCEDEYDLSVRTTVKSNGKEILIENKALASALTILLPKYREVLYLSYFMEHNDSEISRMLGIPVSTVNKRRASAIKRLREKMSSEDES